MYDLRLILDCIRFISIIVIKGEFRVAISTQMTVYQKLSPKYLYSIKNCERLWKFKPYWCKIALRIATHISRTCLLESDLEHLSRALTTADGLPLF